MYVNNIIAIDIYPKTKYFKIFTYQNRIPSRL